MITTKYIALLLGATLMVGCSGSTGVYTSGTTIKTTKVDNTLACPSMESLNEMSKIIQLATKSNEEPYLSRARISGANQVHGCNNLTKGMKLEFVEEVTKKVNTPASLVRLPNGWTTWIASENLE